MRLIDADLLHSKLFEIGCHKSKLHPMDVMNMIDEQPTAYDVDKVAEDLDKVSYLIPPKYRWNYADNVVDLGDAIEIVKQGGRKE